MRMPFTGHVSSSLTSLHPWPCLAEPAFHGLAGNLVDAIAPHSEADPNAILIQFLVAFGNVIGHSPHMSVEADRHGTTLFACLAGETAKTRKGTSWGHVRQLFATIDPTWTSTKILSALASGEGLIWHVRDASTDHKGRVDLGVDDKRLLVVATEFATVLAKMRGSTLSTTLRQAWDGTTLTTPTKRQAATATNPHISVIGHITVDELQRRLTAAEISNGFGNRFLWCCVRRAQLLPDGGSPPTETLTPLVDLLKNAVAFASQAKQLTRDGDARALWRKIYPSLATTQPGLVGDVCNRAEAQVLRLSCLYALLDQSTVVQQPHLEAALAVWRYAEASAHWLFGSMLGNPTAEKLLHLLRLSPEGLTTTDLHAALHRHSRAEQMAEALELLSTRNLIITTERPTPGRPATVYHAATSDQTRTASDKPDIDAGTM
jgi:hypothetical protein